MHIRAIFSAVVLFGFLPACNGDSGNGETDGGTETETSGTDTDATGSTSSTGSSTSSTGDTTGDTTGATGSTTDGTSTSTTGVGTDSGGSDCALIMDMADCDAQDGCAWVGNEQNGSCVDAVDACGELKTEAQCTALPTCNWDADAKECVPS